jgi:hypothetical protein
MRIMIQRRHRLMVVGTLLVLLIALGAAATASAQDERLSPLEFQNQMRQLWEDHIVWTRMYIVSVVEELPDAEFVAQRLLANQDTIGEAVKPFYGDEAGNQLSLLLRDHILGAVALLDAAKAGDADAAEAASEAWYANADDVAEFLHGANADHWSRDDLAHEMQMHLDLTLQEAQARLTGDYAADIAAYDEIHHHILHMADILSDGIIQQFPERFAS